MKKKRNPFCPFESRQRFSIRKLSIGVSSILLATLMAGGYIAEADEMATSSETTTVEAAMPSGTTTTVVEVVTTETSSEPVATPASTSATVSSSTAASSTSEEKNTSASSTSEPSVATPESSGATEPASTAVEVTRTAAEAENVSSQSSVVPTSTISMAPAANSSNNEAPSAAPQTAAVSRTTYSLRTAANTEPEVIDEENRKRLDYYKQLNESGLSRIEIPNGMTVIDANAFKGNTKITEVIIPETVTTIGEQAFYGTSLKNITLPKNLQYLGKESFANISTLTEAVVPKSLVNSYSYYSYYNNGERAFADNKNLKKITFEDGISFIPPGIAQNTGISEVTIPESVTIIRPSAFYKTSLKTLVIPDSVTEIGSYAFAENDELVNVRLSESLTTISNGAFGGTTQLSSINIPRSVRSINDYAFNKSGLTTIVLNEGLSHVGYAAFSGTKLKEVTLPSSLETVSSAFSYIPSLSKVTIQSNLRDVPSWYESHFVSSPIEQVIFSQGVTQIPSYLLNNQKNLKEVVLPAGLKEIGHDSFRNTSLTNILIPHGTEKIYGGAFRDIESLTTAHIPSTLLEANGAFVNSKNLKTITFEAGTKKIADGLLSGTSFSEFAVPEGIEEIGVNAFSNNANLTKVTLPSTLKNIGQGAFSYTGLKTLVLPSGLKKIPSYFLNGTNVDTIIIPEGVEEIGDNAFYGNTKLKNVQLPSTLKKIGERAFEGASIESLTFPAGLTEIGRSAFAGNKISVINLPSTLTTIGQSAFANNQIQEIHLPENLSDLGDDAFANNDLKEVHLPAKLQVLGTAFVNNGNLSRVTFAEGLKEIRGKDNFSWNRYSAFSGTAISNLTLPESLERIGDGAFYNLSSLKNISLPNNVKTIGNGAFQGTGLSEITLPAELTYIGHSAFSGTKITHLVLPTKLETIESDAFNISTLTSVVIPKSLKESGYNGTNSSYIYGAYRYYPNINGAFSGAKNLKDIQFEVGIREIPRNLFAGSGIETLTLPDTVVKIGDNAFYSSKLTNVTLSSTLEEIGAYAFGSTLLKEVVLPDNVQAVGYGAFSDVASLKTVTLSSRLKKIEDKTFYKTGLEDILIPDSITEIGAIAFADTPLVSVTLSQNLENIRASAFRKTNLKTVVLPDNIKVIEESAFGELQNLAAINIPFALKYGDGAFSGSKNLASVTFEDGRTEIPSGLLRNIGLKEFTIPQTIVSIGQYAFADNEKLEKIVFSDRLESIERYAFTNSGVKEVILPDSLKYMGEGSFTNNPSLTRLKLSENLKYVPNSAFSRTSLEKLELPASVEIIYPSAFSESKLKEIKFAEGLNTIAGSAFSGNKLEQVELPKSLKHLASGSFSNNLDLRLVIIQSDFDLQIPTWIQYASYGDSSPFADYQPNGQPNSYAGKTIFVSFKDGVTAIPENLFKNVKRLVHAEFSDDVKEIRRSAFEGTNLTFLTLPESIEILGEFAFGNSDKLTSVNIPKSLVTADRAFHGSKKLNELRNIHAFLSEEGGVRIPDGMFENTGVTTFIVPEGIKEIGKYAFLNNKTVKASLTSTPHEGFVNVILPDSLTKIESRAFESTSLDYVHIPNSVSEIGDGAFRFNPNLTSIRLPKELTKLAGYLFEGNEKLTQLILPSKVESIDSNAFVNMPNLVKVYIPSSVKTIEENLIVNPNTKFYVHAGSYAESYMKERGILYEITGDDFKFYNDGIVKESRFVTTSQTLKHSGHLSVRLEYQLDTANRDISDLEIVITLPDDKIEFVDKIKLNGVKLEADVTGTNKNVLKVKNIDSHSGKIEFIVKTTSEELTYLDIVAQVRYKEYGIQKSDSLGRIHEEMPYLMIKADTAISGNKVRIVGRTKPNTKVEFKIFEPIIGGQIRYIHAAQKVWEEGLSLGEHIISDMTGQFETVLALDFEELFDMSAKQGDNFKIRALAEVEGVQVKADSGIIKINDDAPKLTRFILRHDGREFNLLDGELNDNVIFRPTSPFEFEVGLDNTENISDVWVQTIRNGVARKMQLIDSNGSFKARGYFDLSNQNYIPSSFTVLVVKTYDKDLDGDGLLDEKRMTADDHSKNRWLTDNGYPSLIDSNSDSWDVSDRDLALFSVLTYLNKSVLSSLLPVSGNSTIDYFNFDLLKGDGTAHYQFNDLQIKSSDRKLFDQWVFIDQLNINFRDPEIIGDDTDAFPFHSTVSYFVDKNKESLIVAYRGSDESRFFAGVQSIAEEASVGNALLAYPSNPQERAAKYQMQKIVERVREDFPRIKNLYITGHSLGGYQSIHATDYVLSDPSVSDIKEKLRKTINFNGPGFNLLYPQTEAFERVLLENSHGEVKIKRYLIDAIEIANGVATTGQFPNDFKYEFRKTRNSALDSAPVHNMNSFFYSLDHGYRSSKNRFENAEAYIDVPELSYSENFILTLPETPNYVIDPSGRVVNRVTGKPVVSANAKVYYKNKDGNEVLWNAEDYSQLNPVLTTIHGEYAWDVPEGLWKVKIEKDGYEVAESDWLPVPPPQTEVNFNLQPKTYSLEFNLDGGRVTSTLPTSYMTEVEVALPLAEKEGHDFLGWFDNEARVGTPVATTLFSTLGNKKLWAGWESLLITKLPDTAPTSPELPAVKIETKVRRQETVLTTDVVDYYDDPTLADHLTREEFGTSGLLVTELTDYYVDGVLVRTDTKEISRTEATPKKVYRGTKHVTQVSEVAPTSPELPAVKIETKVRRQETVLNTDVVDYYDDPTLADHLIREESGTSGLVVTELTDYYVDGVLVRTDTKEISRTEATPKKVYRGTKHVTLVPDYAPVAEALPALNISELLNSNKQPVNRSENQLPPETKQTAGGMEDNTVSASHHLPATNSSEDVHLIGLGLGLLLGTVGLSYRRKNTVHTEE